MTKKQKIQKIILQEIIKENWDSELVERLAGEMNQSNKDLRILQKISDELPFIAARVCGTEVFQMITGSRKAETVLALKFCYKELYDNHGYTYQMLADRFNRGKHDNVLKVLNNLNDRLETGDIETTELYREFKNEVMALRIMLSS